MAVGFTPKFTQNINLNNVSRQYSLAVAFKTMGALGWEVIYISPAGLIAYTNKGIFATNAEVKIIFLDNNTISVTSSSTGSEMVDFGKNKKNAEKFIDTYKELAITTSDQESDLIYNELLNNFPKDKDLLLETPPSVVQCFLSIFMPTKGYVVTPILLLINIAIFIIMVSNGISFMEPGAQSMITWGANFKPLTLDGEWYRLFTCCFIHFGILHLAFNMYALIYIGLLLEGRLGTSRFLAGYILTGIISSAASLWWNDFVISGGASGAIFGMYGLFLALLTTNVIDKSLRQPMLVSIGIFIVINLFNGFAVTGIDNAAHVGGLVSGIIIGYLFVPALRKPESASLKFGSIAVATLFVASTLFTIFSTTTNDLGKYDANIKKFTAIETKALEVYDTNAKVTKAEMLENLEKGIQYWKQNSELIKETDQLDLPERLHKQTKQLVKYCALRLESYTLLHKNISEGTQAYNYRLTEINGEIESLIKEISGRTTEDPPPSK